MSLDIIIPCYYKKEIIRPCLEKIANQTIIKNINVILVNDCSPNTDCEYQDLIQEFFKRIIIHYLKTPKNVGPGTARQIGLNNSTADWIMFIDDDDELYDDTSIESLLSLANINDVVSVGGQTIVKNIDTQEILEKRAPWVHIQGSIFNRRILQENNIHFEPLISYREEDGAFSSYIDYTLQQYKQLKLYKPVYIKKVSKKYQSITSKSFGVDNIINLIGSKAYELDYIQMGSNNHYSGCEQVFLIANLLDFLVNYSHYQITLEQYLKLFIFIDKVNRYSTTYDIQWLPRSYMDYSKEYNEALGDDLFGHFTYDSVVNFFVQKDLWLNRLSARLK